MDILGLRIEIRQREKVFAFDVYQSPVLILAVCYFGVES